MALNSNTGDADWTGELELAPQTDNDGNVIGGGLVLPPMTTTERDAISAPKNGTLVHNTTTNKINARLNGAWEAVTSS